MDNGGIVVFWSCHHVVGNTVMKKLYLNLFVLSGLIGGLLVGWCSYEYYSRHKDDCFIELKGIKEQTFCLKMDGEGNRFYQSADYRIYIR